MGETAALIQTHSGPSRITSLAVGVWGAVLTSSDGLEWLYHAPHASENNLNAVAFGADAFVAVGGLGDSTGLS